MSIQDILAELRTTYVASIQGKVESIDELWTTGRMRELETEFHKLKGTGRTYGLPEITTIGALMENLCKGASKDVQSRERLTSALPIVKRLLITCRDQRVMNQVPDLEKEADFIALKRLDP